MIGCRVHFTDEPHCHWGTVTGVTTTSNGYGRLLVRWDEGAPEWWGSVLNPDAGGLIVEPDS